jgi:DNA-binding CsgD family transcriptional regulator
MTRTEELAVQPDGGCRRLSCCGSIVNSWGTLNGDEAGRKTRFPSNLRAMGAKKKSAQKGSSSASGRESRPRHSVMNGKHPRDTVRNPRPPTFDTAQEKLVILSDEQMRENCSETYPRELARLKSHVARVYADAHERRKYRQVHVMKNWDEYDCKILFMLILGYPPKNMAIELGITRQAIEKRLKRMRQQVGVSEDTQLVLWILGFVTLHSDGKMATTGTTLIGHDFSTPFSRHISASIRIPALDSTKD